MKIVMRTLLGLVMAISGMAMISQKKTRVVFFGDSITAAGADKNGFISLLQTKLQTGGRGKQFELLGAGVSGNKVYDLVARLDRDVLAKAPDVVVIWIGVNDVWHKSSFGTGTDADKFEAYYTSIIKQLQSKNVIVVVATPAVIGERTDHSNAQDGDLNHYSNIIRKLAVQHKCGLVDLRKAFLEHNLEHNRANKDFGILTTDRVHLNEQGNRLVAEKLLQALVRR